jgi:benzylsuccinate CoA-transferase BbsF subunit
MKKSIFEGLKVADFTGAIAGPLTTRFLASQGATVIKVECHRHPDSVRLVSPYKDMVPGIDRSVQFAFYNYGKYSISLDLARPQGQDIARRLIEWSDVLIENMVPGAMEKWGLDYERVRKLKPDIIYLSSSSLGRTGPLSGYAAWGYHHGPLAGFSHLTGWPDRLPCGDSIAYTDSVAPSFSIIALIGALLYRRREGKGLYLDQSQTEAGAYFLGPVIMDYFANGRIAERQGDRDSNMVPHGIFPCSGEDRWVAIAVSDQEEWKKFCLLLKKEAWIEDERFKTLRARKHNENELEKLISQWTRQRTSEEVMDLCQKAGIPAGKVANAEDLFNDPQLNHREHFKKLEHKEIGAYTIELPSVRFSKMPHQPQHPAPLLGEHTDLVLRDILGYTDEEIAEFLIEGVITTDEDLPANF